jgi:hypothetical protein
VGGWDTLTRLTGRKYQTEKNARKAVPYPPVHCTLCYAGAIVTERLPQTQTTANALNFTRKPVFQKQQF